MKYIFIAGAPGSKWSSVIKNIYFSLDIDQSDYSEQRLYYHDATGSMELMHLGSYFDPGMEFGGFFDRLDQHSIEECEREFDRPFSGAGTRMIRSHVFCHHLDFLKKNWPDSPILLVHRPDDACLGWWVKCGHFDITYPSYHDYYRDLRTMARSIAHQNRDLMTWRNKHNTLRVNDNIEICEHLGLQPPPAEYRQYYNQSDVMVEISWNT